MLSSPRLTELRVGGELSPWIESGFAPATDGESLVIGALRVRCLGDASDPGIHAWSFDDADIAGIDGLDTTFEVAPDAGQGHPNHIVGIDHVVVQTPDLDRTSAAFVDAGFEIRRTREAVLGGGATMRQAFIRAGDAILELVGPLAETDDDSPAWFWGLALTSSNLDATAASFGDVCSEPRPAVQPGRRIATLDTRRLGLGVRIAVMSQRAVGT